MKKVLSFILVLALLIPVLANTFVYARSESVCPINGSSHDYTYSWSIRPAHPHTGHVECECGDIIYTDEMIDEDCDICRELLCEKGIHNYLAHVYSTFGECYCGESICFPSTAKKFDTHLEHYNQGSWYSSCYFCNLGDEYYEEYFNFMATYAISHQTNDNYPDDDDYYYDYETPVITHTGNSHDASPSIIQRLTHPHKGYLECSCGLRSYFDNSIHFECTECRDEPCNIGIHYYTYEVYCQGNIIYATCFCGKTISIDCSYDDYTKHLNHTDAVYVSCPICTLGIECSSSYYNYITESVMSFWEEPISDEIYYAEDDYNFPDIFESEHEQYYFTSYNCTVTSGEHNFTSGSSYTTEHPHSGYYTCWCDEELHFDASYLEECAQCRVELCSSGIHDFSYELSYTDSTKKNGYGRCYCGATMNFSDAINKYNRIGLELELDDFNVPCASCTFKAILSNDLVAFQTNKLQNTDTISNIYNNYDIVYAYNHYADVTKYKYNWNCTHSDCYLENKPIISPVTEQKPTITPNTKSTITNSNSNYSASTNTSQEGVKPLIPYYEYDLPEFYNMQSIQLPDRDYKDAINDVASQLFLGNYSEKVTTTGTVAEVIFSLTGFDVYKDFTDFWYNLSHWEFTWGHVGNTILSAVALLPIVGVVKNTDEIALLRKLAKLDPDTVKNLDKIGGINSSLLLKLKKLSQSEVLDLMKKLDGHALTKHVGNTTEASLKALRKGTNAISSFYTQDEAVKAVTSALKDPDVMAKIAYKMSLDDTAKFAVEFDVGKTIGVKIPKDSDKMVKCSKVRVIIQQTSDTEFYVKTAFPI